MQSLRLTAETKAFLTLSHHRSAIIILFLETIITHSHLSLKHQRVFRQNTFRISLQMCVMYLKSALLTCSKEIMKRLIESQALDLRKENGIIIIYVQNRLIAHIKIIVFC